MKNSFLALVAIALSFVSLNALAQKISPVSKHAVAANTCERVAINVGGGGWTRR